MLAAECRSSAGRAEHRLVGLDVDVDVLELADLLPVAVDQRLSVPFADVLVMGHCFGLLPADAVRPIPSQLTPGYACPGRAGGCSVGDLTVGPRHRRPGGRRSLTRVRTEPRQQPARN
jgi:hypothetical protein